MPSLPLLRILRYALHLHAADIIFVAANDHDVEQQLERAPARKAARYSTTGLGGDKSWL
jgi:hypothetical protein